MERWRRREVVKAGIATLTALPSLAITAGAQQVQTNASGPFLVRDGESRATSPMTIAGQPFASTKIAGGDVQGRFAVLQINTPPGRGPETHVHSAQNEWFFVLRGSIGLKCGGEPVVLKTGDSFLAPLGVPHAYVAMGSEPARLVNLFDPAGQIEAFFEEYAHVLNQPGRPDVKRLASVYETHGMRVVGPPLRTSEFTA